MMALKQASACPRQRFIMQTCPVSKYKDNLVLVSLIDGMVMKEKAATACFNGLSSSVFIIDPSLFTCLTKNVCTASKCEYLDLEKENDVFDKNI